MKNKHDLELQIELIKSTALALTIQSAQLKQVLPRYNDNLSAARDSGKTAKQSIEEINSLAKAEKELMNALSKLSKCDGILADFNRDLPNAQATTSSSSLPPSQEEAHANSKKRPPPPRNESSSTSAASRKRLKFD